VSRRLLAWLGLFGANAGAAVAATGSTGAGHR
jgi:hypothetical protein